MEQIKTNEEDRAWCVYIHTSPNNKKYVGITGQTPPEKRWDEGRGYPHNAHFTSAIKKYGWNNFKHEIVANNLTALEAEEMERDLIQEYNTMNPKCGYNLTSGGESGKRYSEEAKRNISLSLRGEKHPNYGKHHSEETKRKISEGNKGKIVSEETRKKMSEINKGRTYSEEYKQHMSEVLKGRVLSDEWRKHVSEGLKGREFSEEHRNNLSEAMKEVWKDEKYRESRSGENHPLFGCGEKNPMFGKHHSEESRKKMSEAAKERMSNPENCPNYGKHLSDETKEKLREAQLLYWTDEKRKELSEARKGKYIGENNPNWGNHKLAGAANPRAKKVIRLSDQKIYDYIGQAAEDNGVGGDTIRSRCKKHKGFMFYEDYLAQLTQQND
jgi:group I intron endonuclease